MFFVKEKICDCYALAVYGRMYARSLLFYYKEEYF